MLVPLQRLLLRTRHVRSRADELGELAKRIHDELRAHPGPEERALALELRALKVRVSAALVEVHSCSRCASGKPGSRGVFPGGDCCSSVTADLFDDDELAALVQAGTRTRDLHAPRTTHAGCSFRGDMGCTLSAEDRPERCVHYVCGTLKRELIASHRFAEIEPLLVELQALMKRFVALRRARLDDEILGATS